MDMATTVDIATSVVTCVAMETMTDIKQKQNPIKTAIINKVTCLLLYEPGADPGGGGAIGRKILWVTGLFSMPNR